MKRSTTLFCTLLLLILSAAPAFAGRVLAEIEYFYSDDGTLTGKAFNGKRVNFEYDLRGQLLTVGYLLQDEWISVIANPFNPPEWFINQNGKSALVTLFGAEIG